MSLIIDNLKKIQKYADHSSVPPGMVERRSKRREVKRVTVLFVILLLALAAVAAVSLVDTGETSYKTAPPAVINFETAKIPTNIKQTVQESVQAPAEEPKPEMPSNGVMKYAGAAAVMKRLPAAAEPSSAPPEPVKQEEPEQSPKQSAEFRRKIEYNTLTATANKALTEKRYARAAEYYRKALSMKRSPANLTDLLLAEIELGNVEAVNTELRRYSESADDKAVAAAALEMSRTGHSGKALVLLDSYMGRFATDGRLYYAEGQVRESGGDYSRAAFAYGQAASMFPADPYYAYAYARMLDMAGEYDKAVKEYARVAALSSGGEAAKNASERITVLRNYLAKKKEATAKD
jgi:tetratricopeptide (TPR) repeat protein